VRQRPYERGAKTSNRMRIERGLARNAAHAVSSEQTRDRFLSSCHW
jgi:hypothetical protein